MDLPFAIEDIEYGFDRKVRFITGHYLMRFNARVELAFAAIGFRRFQFHTGRCGVIRMNPILIVCPYTRRPAVSVKTYGARIRLDNERLDARFDVCPETGKTRFGIYYGGRGVRA